MKINFFSCILALLAITSIAKVGTLFDRVRFHSVNSRATSLFINIANAEEATKEENSSIAASTSAAANNNVKSLENVQTQQAKTDKLEEDKVQDISATAAKGIENLLPLKLNGDEVRLLKELAKRRESLDKREQQLNLKDSMIKATEDKLTQKMSELKGLQDKVDGMLKQYEDKENMRIRSLAKIYENMKPKEAAKIFDELELPILFEIVKNMKEAKVAPIIAGMNPAKAKDLSLEFTKKNVSPSQITQ